MSGTCCTRPLPRYGLCPLPDSTGRCSWPPFALRNSYSVTNTHKIVLLEQGWDNIDIGVMFWHFKVLKFIILIFYFQKCNLADVFLNINFHYIKMDARMLETSVSDNKYSRLMLLNSSNFPA